MKKIFILLIVFVVIISVVFAFWSEIKLFFPKYRKIYASEMLIELEHNIDDNDISAFLSNISEYEKRLGSIDNTKFINSFISMISRKLSISNITKESDQKKNCY